MPREIKLENGIYAGFRTFEQAEAFAKKHNVEKYSIYWSHAEACYVVDIKDQQTQKFTRKANTQSH